MKNTSKKNTFRYEISGLLILKVILLWLIWTICFSHPVENHDEKIMSQEVTSHFFGSNLNTSQQNTKGTSI